MQNWTRREKRGRTEERKCDCVKKNECVKGRELCPQGLQILGKNELIGTVNKAEGKDEN